MAFKINSKMRDSPDIEGSWLVLRWNSAMLDISGIKFLVIGKEKVRNYKITLQYLMASLEPSRVTRIGTRILSSGLYICHGLVCLTKFTMVWHVHYKLPHLRDQPMKFNDLNHIVQLKLQCLHPKNMDCRPLFTNCSLVKIILNNFSKKQHILRSYWPFKASFINFHTSKYEAE